MNALVATSAGGALVRSLEAAGWQLLNVDIDLCTESARIELRQGDLHVTFDARNGRASITRELMRTEQVRVGRKGDAFIAHRIRPEFIGRQAGLGLRSGLLFLSNYVADNSQAELSREAASLIFQPLLTESLA